MVVLSLYYYYVEWMVVILYLRGIKWLEDYLQTRLPLLRSVTIVQYNERFRRTYYFFLL